MERLSATRLGREYGVTGEEMNCILVKLGYLGGPPGNYFPTEKALPYVIENECHRGCGGYSWYNRSWVVRTFDESIKDVLTVTDELVKEVRADLDAVRAARQAARVAEQARIRAERLMAEQAAKEAAERAAERVGHLKKAGVIVAVVLGTAAVAYGVYKAAPHVKRWWINRKQKPDHGQEEPAAYEDLQ